MKKNYLPLIVLTILLSAACNTDTDKDTGSIDSIGNPTPNPRHTDTLQSITDTTHRDTLYR